MEKLDSKNDLAALMARCKENLRGDVHARGYLHDNSVSDENVWRDYGIGAAGARALETLGEPSRARLAALGLTSKALNIESGDGVLLPTYDPADMQRPVGVIRSWLKRNEHRFLTPPAGLIAPADVNDHERVIVTDVPVVTLRLAQAGAKGVVCAEDMAVLQPLKDWLSGRNLILASSRTRGLEELKKAAATLGLKAQSVLLHNDLPRTNAEALALVGIDKTALKPPPVAVPPSPFILRDLIQFAQARLEAGEGRAALAAVGADHVEFIRAYNLGFLPAGFRTALNAEARQSLHRHRIESAVIVPAYDESGVVVDLLAIHPDQAGGKLQVGLLDKTQGLIAPKAATTFNEIVAVDSFRLASCLFKSGRRNVMLFRGLADLQNNVERLWKSGVRSAEVMFRRNAIEAVAALEAAGISAVRQSMPRSFDAPPCSALETSISDDTPFTFAEPEASLPVLLPARAGGAVQGQAGSAAVAPETPSPVLQLVEPPEPVAGWPTPELISHDPRFHHAIFKSGDATYAIEIGYDRTSKLEIRLERGGHVHLDRLDLASEVQRKRFSTSAALETKVPCEIIAEHLVHLLGAVRQFQEELSRPGASRAAVLMSDAERVEALEYLKRPDLLDAIAGDMTKLAWVGEEKLKRMMFLIGVSRLLEKPVSGVLRAPPSAGKSFAIDMTINLLPPEEVVHLSSMSASALNYQANLQHAVLVIDEADALAPEVIVALRVLQSRGALSRSSTGRDALSGQTVAQFSQTVGPVAVLTSTASADLDMEFLSRCYDLSLDVSVDQTARILAAQRRAVGYPVLFGKGRDNHLVLLHRNIQRILRQSALPVFVPFADRIEFPSQSHGHRREQGRFLALIQASALLHLHQRMRGEVGGEEVILATLQDYEIAAGLAVDSIGRASDDLSRNARDMVNVIRMAKLAEFDINELKALKPDWTRHKLRAGLAELLSLEVVSSPRRARPRRYTIVPGAMESLDGPNVRLLPAAAIGDLATNGETGFANTSSGTALG